MKEIFERKSMDRDTEIKATKQIRADVDNTLQAVKDMPSSREISLCITKLQEAIMWAGMNLKRLHDGQTCYPESYNPSNTIIEPTKDGIRL